MRERPRQLRFWPNKQSLGISVFPSMKRKEGPVGNEGVPALEAGSDGEEL